MTDNEKISMEKSMHNFQLAKKDPRLVYEDFLRDSVDVLERLVEAVKDNPFFRAIREAAEIDDEDYYDEDAIVLYAEPGREAALIEEGEAIDEMMMKARVSTFEMRYITEDLMAVYPSEYAFKNRDGRVFVAGPLYICHPVVDEDDDEDDEEICMDLTAVDFCEAMDYLATHTRKVNIISNTITGFVLDKED